MRFRLLTSLTVLVVGIVIPATARQGDSPQLLFEAGHKAEVVDGDLRGAIRQYQAALQRFGTNRTIAAEALSRMATAYEKLGDPQAQRIYERLAREYGNEAPAAAARARLHEASKPATPSMTERLAWSGPTVDGFGTISPDGRLLTYVDWNSTGNLMVHDFETGADRRLTGKTSWGETGQASYSAISKTGTQVAYAWFNEHNVCELRLASLEGTGIPESRKVFTNDDIENISPFDWSPDGRWVAAHLQRKDKSGEIALIAVSDGTRRALKSTDWRGPTKIFFSPDGRFVAYRPRRFCV